MRLAFCASVLSTVAGWATASPASEASPDAGVVEGAGTAEAEEGAQSKSKGPSFAVVPGPFYNPNQGVGLLLIPMVMFRVSEKDEVSPPSVATLIGMYSVLPPLNQAGTNYSWMIGAMARLYLDEDRWRTTFALAYFDLYREYHGIGGDPTQSDQFNYRQMGAVGFAQVLREVGVKHLYAGLILGYVTFRATTEDPANQDTLDTLGTGSTWSGQANLGVAMQYDTRNNQYYPSKGLDINLRVNGSLQSGDQYLVIIPNLSQYFALSQGDRLVLAYNVFAQFGFGDLPLPFYANYGSRGTILGYPAGEYVDKMMLGALLEVLGEIPILFSTPEAMAQGTFDSYDRKRQYLDHSDQTSGFRYFEERMLARFFPPPPAHLLAHGVGGGRELLALARAGYTVEGYEPAPPLAAAAQRLMSANVPGAGPVRTLSLQEWAANPSGTFGGVFTG